MRDEGVGDVGTRVFLCLDNSGQNLIRGIEGVVGE